MTTDRPNRNAILFLGPDEIKGLISMEEAVAAIEQGYREADEEVAAELEGRLDSLRPEEREVLRKTLHRLVGRLLHIPVRALRNSSEEEREMMRRVFSSTEEEQ